MIQIKTIFAPKAMMARIREEKGGILVLTPPRPRSSQRRRLLAQNAQNDYGWVMSPNDFTVLLHDVPLLANRFCSASWAPSPRGKQQRAASMAASSVSAASAISSRGRAISLWSVMVVTPAGASAQGPRCSRAGARYLARRGNRHRIHVIVAHRLPSP